MISIVFGNTSSNNKKRYGLMFVSFPNPPPPPPPPLVVISGLFSTILSGDNNSIDTTDKGMARGGGKCCYTEKKVLLIVHGTPIYLTEHSCLLNKHMVKLGFHSFYLAHKLRNVNP